MKARNVFGIALLVGTVVPATDSAAVAARTRYGTFVSFQPDEACALSVPELDALGARTKRKVNAGQVWMKSDKGWILVAVASRKSASSVTFTHAIIRDGVFKPISEAQTLKYFNSFEPGPKSIGSFERADMNYSCEVQNGGRSR
jgi:hypothetical protein